MKNDPSTPETDEPVQLSTAELEEIDNEFSSFLQRRLILWAVRWTIGFGLTWVIVSYWPEYSWLWWVAGGCALASLLLLVVGRWMVRRKVKRTSAKVDELNAILREDDGTHDGSRD